MIILNGSEPLAGATSLIDVPYIGFDTTPPAIPTAVGATYWDEQDKTLNTIMADGVTLQHGQEMYVRGVNKTGAIIPNGSAVFISGAQGNRAKISLADADNYADSKKLMGITTQAVAINAEGYVTITGLVRDLNTNAWVEGTCLYLSQTPGVLTATPPPDGKARMQVGMVVKSHPTDGWICIRVSEQQYIFGDPDGGNYSYFESDGTYVAKGNAITYRDEYVGGDYFIPFGATAPDVVSYTIGGVVTSKYSFDGTNTIEKLGNTFEVAHDIALDQVNAGTLPIEIHVHIAPTTTGTGIARFIVDWRLIKANGAPIAGTQVILTKTITSNQQYYNLLIGANLAVPAGGFGVGDLIEFTLSRDPQNAGDTYGSDIAFYKIALHVPCDTNGSRTTYTK